MLKRTIGFWTVLLLAVLITGSAMGASDWKPAYQDFILSGEYSGYLRAGNPEYAEILYDRDSSWDSFALYDLDLDGTPELLARIDYAIEQVDVFTFKNGRVGWVGTMGGDNFFQAVLCYDGAGIRGSLYTLEGGPAMTIAEYRIGRAGLIKRSLGRTMVDSDGEETIGLDLYDTDSTLESLLYGSTVRGQDRGEYLIWTSRNDLGTSSGLNTLFSMERKIGSWY